MAVSRLIDGLMQKSPTIDGEGGALATVGRAEVFGRLQKQKAFDGCHPVGFLCALTEENMVLVGILLVSGFALIAVESVGYVRGGYNSAFWRLPLDDKLDHVEEHRRDWWWISIWSLVGLFTVGGGLFGFTPLLADGGEPVLAYVALGGFVISVLGWVLGVAIQAAAISEASKQRVESGGTPEWIHPFWNLAFLLEVFWIVGSNIAFALIGIAILETGVVADWAGWVALIGGAVTAVVVLVLRDGFPQLGILIPAVIGVALLIEAA